MSRRGGTWRVRCTWPEGCREMGLYEYDTQRELRQLYEQYQGKYRCVRHTNPDRNLTPDRTSVSAVLVCTALTSDDGREYGRSWRIEGGPSGSGFNYSSAHKAYAEDWPIGTRLTITASVDIPKGADAARVENGGTPS